MKLVRKYSLNSHNYDENGLFFKSRTKITFGDNSLDIHTYFGSYSSNHLNFRFLSAIVYYNEGKSNISATMTSYETKNTGGKFEKRRN